MKCCATPKRCRAALFGGIAIGLAALLAAAYFIFRGGDGGALAIERERFRYHAVKTVAGLVALVEKPDARRVYLSDADSARDYADFFAKAGCIVATNAPAAATAAGQDPLRYDIVVAAAAGKDFASLGALGDLVAERGILVAILDTSAMTVADFAAVLAQFPSPSPHLWMPGETTWVLAGRRSKGRAVKLSSIFDVFAWEGLFEELAAARCSTVGEVFASYVGDKPVMEGAISALPPEMPLAPEILVTKSPPDIAWISAGDVDDDILADTAALVRSMQNIRRTILQGNILSKKGLADDAIEKWHLAYLRNPNDTLLLERLYRLAVNARACKEVGNVKTAAKCYETMICINPLDVQAITEYATCLRSAGMPDLADEAMKRAKELRNGRHDETPEEAGNPQARAEE